MKLIRSNYLPIALMAMLLSVHACKSKKMVMKAPDPPEAPKVVVPAPPDKPAGKDGAGGSVSGGAFAPIATPAVAKPDYNFANLQFEFNSAILKTSSYPMLDKVAMEMKKDALAKFKLLGYASAEGTPEHNMELSEQRAGAVKIYLQNAGVSDAQMSPKGNGEANPIKPNTTEENRALNRRVEIKKS